MPPWRPLGLSAVAQLAICLPSLYYHDNRPHTVRPRCQASVMLSVRGQRAAVFRARHLLHAYAYLLQWSLSGTSCQPSSMSCAAGHHSPTMVIHRPD